jgi:hypothetical protein
MTKKCPRCLRNDICCGQAICDECEIDADGTPEIPEPMSPDEEAANK